jgi:hypothetical protein
MQIYHQAILQQKQAKILSELFYTGDLHGMQKVYRNYCNVGKYEV